MSLKSVVTNVANECGYTVEANVASSTEVTTKQLRTICNRIVNEMADQYPWPLLYASGSITLVAGQATYELPAAFSYYHYNTFWNSSNRWKLLGPMTPQTYAEVRGFGLNPTIYQRFQIRGLSNNQLLIDPTPPANQNGNIIIFEYIADRPVRPANWTTATVYAANSYTFNNGNYYTTTAGGTSGATAPTHTSGSVSDGGVTWTYFNGAYKEFLSDTDVCVFNEKTLELGVLERFAEIHGLDTIQKRYEIQLNEDYSRQQNGQIINVGFARRNDMFARNGTAVFGVWI